MTFAELEQEWLRRKRGRRKERTIAAIVLLAVLGASAWVARLLGAF